MLPFANYSIPAPENNKRKKKKKRPVGDGGRGVGGDELAVVKAAAWAWHQRNEGKPIMREVDLNRAPRTPRPSRYKLEATKNAMLSENKILAENRVSGSSSLWYTESLLHDRDYGHNRYSDLLDAYEIESVSKSIDSTSGSCPMSPISVFQYDRDCDYHQRESTQKRVMNKRKLWKGMILLGPATVCGRDDDVDSRAYSRLRRRPGKVGSKAPAVDGGKARTGHG